MDTNNPAEVEKQNFWQKLISAIGYNQRYFWTTFWFFVIAIVSFIPVFLANKWNGILLGPACLWCLAYLLLGALAGFIFGIPTIITGGLPTTTGNQDPLAVARVSERNEKIVKANTNLTQISDWATKVIVGAGLVQLTKIPGFIVDIAKKMAHGLITPESSTNEHFAAVFAGGIILLFSTLGFIFGYLIMRIILTEIFSD